MNAPGQVAHPRPQETTEHHYQRHAYEGPWPPPDIVPMPGAQRVVSDPAVPVMVCHTCSECGRLRSAGYHRHHPTVPGQPLVLSACRRCKKKAKKKKEKQSAQSYTSVDYPDRTIRIEINDGESRGRARDRVHVVRYRSATPPPTRTAVRSRSQVRVALRDSREERSPPPMLRRKIRTEPRVSSLSPPPDYVRSRRYRSDEPYPAPEPQTRYYRERIVQLSQSPPADRSRPTRFVYQNEDHEEPVLDYRPRSLSPVPVRVRRERRSTEAESRLASHPAPFRTVLPEHRSFMRGSEESISTEDAPRHPASPPPPGILRPSRREREPYPRQMRQSHESTMVEVGGPRVQFGPEPSRRENRHVSESSREQVRRKSRQEEAQHSRSEDYDYYHRHARRGYVEGRSLSPSPPTQSFERLRIRRSPPPDPRSYEEEIRVRHGSPPSRYDEVRVRHVSPPPLPRGRSARQTRDESPESLPYSGYRAFRGRPIEQNPGPSPPPDPRHEDWEDVTESESEGEVVEVRQWRGIDENGQPATFREERRRHLLEPAPPPPTREFPTEPAISHYTYRQAS